MRNNRIGLILVLFLSVYLGLSGSYIYSEEIQLKPSESSGADTPLNISVREERDPFNVSIKLLSRVAASQYVFFNRKKGSSRLSLPKIKITGIMIAGDKVMAAAEIESLGNVTLKPKERIIIKRDKSLSFVVKEITSRELVIIMDNGQEVRGRFK